MSSCRAGCSCSSEEKSMNRRGFLKAAGVSLALPWLEATAFGRSRAAAPHRMVCICTPLGLHAPNFFPEKKGEDYALTPYLEVLQDFRQDFTVISGLSHPEVGSSHDSDRKSTRLNSSHANISYAVF